MGYAARKKKRQESMNQPRELKPPLCSEHRTPMVWDETDFVYSENGIEVIVRHVPAWVCPDGDDVAFPPDVTDELITVIRQLIQVATQAKTDHLAHPQQEYLVRVLA